MMNLFLNVLAGCSLLMLIIAFIWSIKLMLNPGSVDPEFDERIEELQALLDSREEDLE